jgi:hypothetical protein
MSTPVLEVNFYKVCVQKSEEFRGDYTGSEDGAIVTVWNEIDFREELFSEYPITNQLQFNRFDTDDKGQVMVTQAVHLFLKESGFKSVELVDNDSNRRIIRHITSIQLKWNSDKD